MMLRGLGWLWMAVTPITLGFWQFVVPAAIGLAQSLFGNRAQTQAHKRQTASEERRQTESLAAHERSQARRSSDYRFYVQNQLALQRADRDRRAGALQEVGGGLAGVPSGFDFGALAQTGPGVAPMRQDTSEPMPTVTAGAPAFQAGGGGGIAQTMGLLAALGAFGRGGQGGAGQIFTPQPGAGTPERWGMQAAADPFLGWAQG